MVDVLQYPNHAVENLCEEKIKLNKHSVKSLCMIIEKKKIMRNFVQGFSSAPWAKTVMLKAAGH